MERLTERNPYWLGEEFWTSAKNPDEEEVDKVYERLKYYEDLEEQGLLLRLPCKVGDTVYKIGGDVVVEHTITAIKIYEDSVYALVGGLKFNALLFGKTVFLTREEAETALAKMEVQ